MSSENNQNKTEENSNKISNTILLTIDSIIKLKEFLNQDEIKNDYLDIDILFRHYINHFIIIYSSFRYKLSESIL